VLPTPPEQGQVEGKEDGEQRGKHGDLWASV
jgi:hypothetical protein